MELLRINLDVDSDEGHGSTFKVTLALPTTGTEWGIVERSRLLEAGRFDLVLMDCMMPDLDSHGTTAEIRWREGAISRTPILAMTASAMEGDRERCLTGGPPLAPKSM